MVPMIFSRRSFVNSFKEKFFLTGVILWAGLFSESNSLEKIFSPYNLSQDSRQLATQILKEWNVPYGLNLSLYEALVKDYHCQRCREMADSVAFMASLGKSRKEIFDTLFETLEKNDTAFDFAERYRTFDIPTGDSPSFGNPKAKTKIVVFLDYLCGYCKTVRDDLLKQVGTKSNDFQVVFKFFTSPDIAMGVFFARLAFAGNLQGKYNPVSDFIYEIAPSMARSFDEARIYEGLSKLSIDVSKLKKDMNSEKVVRAMKADGGLSVKLKISGTPSIFVNGKPFRDDLRSIFKRVDPVAERVVNGK